jgi:uncharacterized protein (DUF1330 family)
MGTVRPRPDQIQALMEKGPVGPIVMVNLLKFRAHAAYEADKPEANENLTGRQAYERYAQEVQKHLAAVGGRIVWQGPQALVMIGPEDQKWDVVACVRYPSREAFLKMAMSPDYNTIVYHRDAGLEDTALLCCEAGSAA